MLRDLVYLDVLLSWGHSLVGFTSTAHGLFWYHLLGLGATHSFAQRRAHFSRWQVRRGRALATLVELVLVTRYPLGGWVRFRRRLLLSQQKPSLGLLYLARLVLVRLSLPSVCLGYDVGPFSRVVGTCVGALLGQNLVVLHDGYIVFHFMLH